VRAAGLHAAARTAVPPPRPYPAARGPCAAAPCRLNSAGKCPSPTPPVLTLPPLASPSPCTRARAPPLSPPKQHYPPPPWSFLSFFLPSHWSRHHPCLRAARPAASARTAPASPSEAAYFSSNALLPLLLHVCTSPPRHPAPITSFSHHMHHIHDAGGLPHQHGDVRPPRIRSGLKTHSRRCVAGSRTS
jgi:hypothetical protein